MHKTYHNYNTMLFHIDSAQSNLGKQFEVLVDVDYRIIEKYTETDEEERHIFFFHKDHLGSSTQISDRNQNVIHHIEYMPTGELFAEQRDYWHTPYRFNGKELDAETGLYYYGARYYTPEIGIWLSVDPLSDKYPSMSAYMYCAGNSVIYIDPDGREVEYNDRILDRLFTLKERLFNRDFREKFKRLKNSKETYVFNYNNEANNTFTTDGDNLFINYSRKQKDSDGNILEGKDRNGHNLFSSLRHEQTHGDQFEHGELGFTKVKGEWAPMLYDIYDELEAYQAAARNRTSWGPSSLDIFVGNKNIDEQKEYIKKHYPELPENEQHNPSTNKGDKSNKYFVMPHKERREK